jgi:hypothetical protein
MMADVNGESKLLWSNGAVKEFKQTVELAKSALLVDSGTKQILSIAATSGKNAGIHGLAPTGMLVPTTGNAFRVEGNGSAKQPLKKSNHEKYLWIKEEQEDKKKKRQDSCKEVEKARLGQYLGSVHVLVR